ncbi:hypothetical protein HDV57DRAFT_184 [Trichoderma longibrachiatum]
MDRRRVSGGVFICFILGGVAAEGHWLRVIRQRSSRNSADGLRKSQYDSESPRMNTALQDRSDLVLLCIMSRCCSAAVRHLSVVTARTDHIATPVPIRMLATSPTSAWFSAGTGRLVDGWCSGLELASRYTVLLMCCGPRRESGVCDGPLSSKPGSSRASISYVRWQVA